MIIVFGSINIDLVTRVDHIAAPGETVLGPSYDLVPGGKGANQALAARRAGSHVTLVGAVGRDDFAVSALALLRQDGVDLAGVESLDAPTGAAFISVDARGQNAITVASGANARARGARLEGTRLQAGDLLLLQREVPDAEAAIAAATARSRGGRVILNLAPSGRIPDAYLATVDILVANEHEAQDLARDFGVADGQAGLAAELRRRFGTATVVTLGPEGARGWSADGVEHRVAAPRVSVVDTTAAGDSFVGAFAAGLDAGLSFEDALRRGTIAGSLACSRAGAQSSIPSLAEIDAVIAGGGIHENARD